MAWDVLGNEVQELGPQEFHVFSWEQIFGSSGGTKTFTAPSRKVRSVCKVEQKDLTNAVARNPVPRNTV